MVSVLSALTRCCGLWADGFRDWGPKSGYLWFGTSCVGIVWTYFRLPEPKGRTYGELDILFEDRVPARNFASTKVDEFAAAERDAAAGGGGGMVH